MSTRDEDEAWRAIVENYGERHVLAEDANAASPAVSPDDDQSTGPVFGPQPRPETPDRPKSRPSPAPAPRPATEFRPFAGVPDNDGPAELAPHSQDNDEDGFVPPVPDLPPMERRRLAAWLAVLGAPAAFVLGAVADVNVTGTFAAVLALCFVAGVAALVFSMPQDPKDPWDDGARV